MKLKRDMLVHGVYIVAAQHRAKRAAMTLSWTTQVGRDRIAICLGKQSRTRELILASRAFGISMLRKDQLEIARAFAAVSSRHEDKLRAYPFHTIETDSPILKDCVAAFDCVVDTTYREDPKGIKIIVGRIVAAELPQETYTPLLYRESDYPRRR